MSVPLFAGLLCILLPPEAPATASARERWLGKLASAKVYQTAADTSDRLTEKDSVTFGEDFAFSGPTITVDEKQGQAIVGFGGSFTEAAAVVFDGLSYKEQEKLLQRYFGPDGIGYTVGRVHMNSCDFSLDNYDFDGHDSDTRLVHFDKNVSRDTKDLIPFILRAKRAVEAQGQKLRVLGSPWSPPSWMKTNEQMDGSGKPCLKDGMQEPWAKYMTKWVTAYKQQHVPIWGITVQNEPEYAAPWDACTYSPQEEADFLGNNLGPAMRDKHPDVHIFAYDHNKDHLEEWAEAVYGHPTAAEYVSGLAFHWYAGDNFDAVHHVHSKYPEALLLPSEATFERVTNGDGSWDMGEGYAHDILHDLNAGSVGWIDWNLLLNQEGGPNHVNNFCDAAMMVDSSTGKVQIHPQFFYLGHFSKFILQDSIHLQSRVEGSRTYRGRPRGYGTCTGDDGLQATAFDRPDGLIALVVLNCGDKALDFKINFADTRAARASIPAHAIQTYLITLGVARSTADIGSAEALKSYLTSKTVLMQPPTATTQAPAKQQPPLGLIADSAMSTPGCRVLIGQEGEQCPQHALPLTENECKEAAFQFGKSVRSSFRDSSQPHGCFSSSDGYFQLNTHPNGSSCVGSTPYCKVCHVDSKCVYAAGVYGENKCLAHSEPLTPKECQKAQKRLGTRHGFPLKVLSARLPHGCVWARTHFLFNMHETGGQVLGSAPFCKYCGIAVETDAAMSDAVFFRKYDLTVYQATGHWRGRVAVGTILASTAGISLAALALFAALWQHAPPAGRRYASLVRST